MSRTTPVIQLASSEARYTAARATSCGVPSPPQRVGLDQFLLLLLGIQALFFSVRIVSGAMQLARMPWGPTWAARFGSLLRRCSCQGSGIDAGACQRLVADSLADRALGSP